MSRYRSTLLILITIASLLFALIVGTTARETKQDYIVKQNELNTALERAQKAETANEQMNILINELELRNAQLEAAGLSTVEHANKW